MTKVILIHGNGGDTTENNWFPSVKSDLEKKGIEVIARVFPDAQLARESYWMPFLIDELKPDENTIIVGHSSGAIAAMKLAEQQKILGSVLVGAYYTDLGIESEKNAGYFNRPWNWDKMKENQSWMILFASQDDPWIPIEEARHIHEKTNCEYHEFTDQGHFGGDYDKKTFPELTTAILRKVKKESLTH